MTFEIIKNAVFVRKGHSYVNSKIKIIAKEARQTAVDKGEKFYFTGLSCRRNHLAKRSATNGQCVECQKYHKLKNKGKYKTSEKAHYNKNINRYKSNERYRLYKITPEQYDVMFKNQNGVCAICKNKETIIFRGKIRELCVDHCKTTKKVRGLLCHQCNIGIGNLKHNSEFLRNAAFYCEEK